ncbi:PQQ-dependent sugar dehydrogenase [Vibrio algarum]|uniref:PQQ-dependent sugar dehydrogenase n=1 Tax=Vibrio algarum TaxID=3020714 RepID=A0ABT4YQT1_9VIBR|nr:PQQ-dependent sugar dehydrogenase [Vibrio sp. KJ40-1]MDB1123835.1 PQQ-dependent sugar dehydrogenase [Vibrio sp. KJ40-1]
MNRLCILLLLLSPISYAEQKFTFQRVTQGLNIPWGLAFTDNDNLIITERTGAIKHLNIASGEISLLFQIPNLNNRGQGGLLDIAVSPQDPSKLYVTYTKSTGKGLATTLAKANYQNGKLSGFKDVLVTDSATDTSRHFGSRISFDLNGHLYFSIGDRGVRENGQDNSNHSGTILRLNLDGSIPTDNPFFKETNTRNEIWSYGHRNPQGLYFDNLTKKLWSIEHGPRGGDEINEIKKGANYGWPITSHGKEYWGPVDVAEDTERPGIEPPKLVYIPSIAPSSLILYRGDHYPALNGKLLASALKLTHINIISFQPNGTLIETGRIANNLKQRIRSITTNPKGEIFFSTDDGNIYRIALKDN